MQRQRGPTATCYVLCRNPSRHSVRARDAEAPFVFQSGVARERRRNLKRLRFDAILNDLVHAVDEGKQVDACFVDFEKAFDKVPHGTLMKKVNEMILDKRVVEWRAIAYLVYTVKRHDGNTARIARRSDEELGVRVSVARIAPSLLDHGHSVIFWKAHSPSFSEAEVAERLDCSPPTKAKRAQSPAGSLPDFRNWESCRTMALVGGFSLESSGIPALAFQRCSILTSFHKHRLSRLRC
ncbi:hypothetical protein PR048_027089 [Dryococelus australis]|uniref:Reverse transcriptase domain-containing protein n=1 Tax=Dryococelus australis TaxID=614101 RepID=A0ABQ9GEG6_9NEOP|nr:hypothetical protein PR048_027089 [Dryococelus australis]